MKRDSAATIFRTVVFAGAMLGTPACSKKAATTTPKNATTTEPAKTTDPAMMGDAENKPDAPDATDDTAKEDPDQGGQEDPCAGDPRPRGTDDDGGGGMGRGFILS